MQYFGIDAMSSIGLQRIKNKRTLLSNYEASLSMQICLGAMDNKK